MDIAHLNRHEIIKHFFFFCILIKDNLYLVKVFIPFICSVYSRISPFAGSRSMLFFGNQF